MYDVSRIDFLDNFENFKFENTSGDVNSANEKVSNIFEKMAKRSCKIVKTSRNKTNV
jgi:hypothetical protein